MAQFYQPLENTSADWTGASKGFKSNNIFGDIAEGLGETIKMASTAADEYYKGTINEEVKTASEGLYKEFGNDAAVASETGIHGTATPKEIQSGVDRLALLKQAAQAGTLKDSSFWAQAEQISRQLKMQYPGYWQEIDNSIASQLGRKPAQALQAELQQERNANSTKADREYENAKHAAREAGIADPFVAEAHGQKMVTEEINYLVASRNAIKWSQEVDDHTYKQRKQSNELTEDKVLKAAGQEAQTQFAAMAANQTSPFFKTRQEYDALSKQYLDLQSRGQPVPPELQSKITAVASQFEANTDALVEQIKAKYGGDVDQTKLDGRVNWIKDFAKDYTRLVKEGDKVVGSHNTALVKSVNDYDTFKIMQSYDAFRISHAMQNILGPQGYSTFLTLGGPAGSDLFKDVTTATNDVLKSKMFLEGMPLNDHRKELQKNGIEDPKAFKNGVDTLMNGIVNPDMPVVGKQNMINSLFGEGNKDFLKEGVKPSERPAMFLKVTAPVVVNKVKEMYDAGQITKEDYNKMYDWSVQNGIYMLNEQSAELNNVSQSRKKISLYYNTETRRLDVSPNKDYEPAASSAVGKTIARAAENVLTDTALGAKDNANKIIARLEKILENNGEDPKTAIPKLLDKSGIELNASEQGPLTPTKELTGLEPPIVATEKFSGDIYSGLEAYQNAKLSPEDQKKVDKIMKEGSWLDLFNFAAGK